MKKEVGMSTIFFDSKAITIFVVTNGTGQLEMACRPRTTRSWWLSGEPRTTRPRRLTGARERKKSPTGEDYQSDGVMKFKLKYFITFLNFLNEDSVISFKKL
ncbi:hypothetical protein ACET3Z_013218 [Daucus carota]